MRATKHLADLPEHLLERIIGLVPLWDRLCSVELVCKTWLALSRSPKHFESLDLEADGFEYDQASNKTLQALVIASLGSRLLAKQLGSAAQLRQSPICRLNLQRSVWRSPAFDWLGPQSLLTLCPFLEELVLPLHHGERPAVCCHPEALPALDARVRSRPIKLAVSNVSVEASRWSVSPASTGSWVAWECLLNLLRPTSWVQLHTLVLRECDVDTEKLSELSAASVGGMLCKLDVGHNPLGNTGAAILAGIVQRMPLQTLVIMDTGFEHPGCQELVNALAASATLDVICGLPEELGPAAPAILQRAGFKRPIRDLWKRNLG